MKQSKKSLKFKKIKIANMNFLKGGGDEDPNVSVLVACQTENIETICSLIPPVIPASDPGNPCSDGCVLRSDACTEAFLSRFC